jgi:hypothetical protein
MQLGEDLNKFFDAHCCACSAWLTVLKTHLQIFNCGANIMQRPEVRATNNLITSTFNKPQHATPHF